MYSFVVVCVVIHWPQNDLVEYLVGGIPELPARTTQGTLLPNVVLRLEPLHEALHVQCMVALAPYRRAIVSRIFDLCACAWVGSVVEGVGRVQAVLTLERAAGVCGCGASCRCTALAVRASQRAGWPGAGPRAGRRPPPGRFLRPRCPKRLARAVARLRRSLARSLARRRITQSPARPVPVSFFRSLALAATPLARTHAVMLAQCAAHWLASA